jgi:hypothetical protein
MSPLHRRFIAKIEQKGFRYSKETKTSKHFRRLRGSTVDEIFVPRRSLDEDWVRATLHRHSLPDNRISEMEIDEVINGPGPSSRP